MGSVFKRPKVVIDVENAETVAGLHQNQNPITGAADLGHPAENLGLGVRDAFVYEPTSPHTHPCMEGQLEGRKGDGPITDRVVNDLGGNVGESEYVFSIDEDEDPCQIQNGLKREQLIEAKTNDELVELCGSLTPDDLLLKKNSSTVDLEMEIDESTEELIDEFDVDTECTTEESSDEQEETMSTKLEKGGVILKLTEKADLKLMNKNRNIASLKTPHLIPNQHFLFNSAGVRNDCWKLRDSLRLKSDDGSVSGAFILDLTLEPGALDPRFGQLTIFIHRETSSEISTAYFKSCELSIDLLEIVKTEVENGCDADERESSSNEYVVSASKLIKFAANENEASAAQKNSFDISTVVYKFCSKLQLRKLLQVEKKQEQKTWTNKIQQISIDSTNPSGASTSASAKGSTISDSDPDPSQKISPITTVVSEFEFIPVRVTASLEIYHRGISPGLSPESNQYNKLVFQSYDYESAPPAELVQFPPSEMSVVLEKMGMNQSEESTTPKCFINEGQDYNNGGKFPLPAPATPPKEKLSPEATVVFHEFQELRQNHRHLLFRFHWKLPIALELTRFGFYTQTGRNQHTGTGGLGHVPGIEELMDTCENVLEENLICKFDLQKAMDIWNFANKYQLPHLESSALFAIVRNRNQGASDGGTDRDQIAKDSDKKHELEIIKSFLKEHKLTHSSLDNVIYYSDGTEAGTTNHNHKPVN